MASELQDYLSAWVDSYAHMETTEYQSFTDYARDNSDMTREQQAAALGVTSRSLRRYLAYERGERGTHAARPVSAKNLSRLRREAITSTYARVARDIRKHGIKVTAFTGRLFLYDNDNRRRTLDKQLHPITNAEAIAAALEKGNLKKAGQAFADAFLEQAYPMGNQYAERAILNEIERLDIEIGA